MIYLICEKIFRLFFVIQTRWCSRICTRSHCNDPRFPINRKMLGTLSKQLISYSSCAKTANIKFLLNLRIRIQKNISRFFLPSAVTIFSSDRYNRCPWRCSFQYHGGISGITESGWIIICIRDRDGHGCRGGKFWICMDLFRNDLKDNNGISYNSIFTIHW